MGVNFKNKQPGLDLTHPVMRGEDGGYYVPSVDENGNLTWTPSEEDMPAVEDSNIAGPAGESGVYVGETEPQDENVLIWLDPDGQPSDDYATKEYVDQAILEAELGGDVDLSDYAKVTYVDEQIAQIELTPGPAGPQGEPGQDGKDGEPGKDGADGAPGQDGAPGKDGEDGYTPVKGTDYWTAADKQEIVNDTVAAIPVASGTEAGLVKPDNSTIIVTPDGTISAVGSGGGGTGEDGGYYTPSVDEDGNLTWVASKSSMPAVAGANIMGPQGIQGIQGEQGPIGVTGPQGEQGIPGEKGQDGQPGANGEDGISVTHSWNGAVLTITSASGTSSMDLQGPQGIQGEQGIQGIQGPAGQDGAPGANGQDGYTPVRGTDYWTEADQAQIVNDVLAALPAAEEVSV